MKALLLAPLWLRPSPRRANRRNDRQSRPRSALRLRQHGNSLLYGRPSSQLRHRGRAASARRRERRLCRRAPVHHSSGQHLGQGRRGRFASGPVLTRAGSEDLAVPFFPADFIVCPAGGYSALHWPLDFRAQASKRPELNYGFDVGSAATLLSYLLSLFHTPEQLNACDCEGLTAPHYAALISDTDTLKSC